ncbi:MAG: 16S rRNA (uracil(1498)-N(3))-methyltransferase [Bacteroidetes bacterium]|nr:MAG: 16S rRNA (uracil(1498)-N(3))-methyltransferase [Bacteroidota bacterium]
MNIFYTSDIINDLAYLGQEEAVHCVRVLRKREGDAIVIIDGKGSMYDAVLTEVTKKKCVARIIKVIRKDQQRNYKLHMAIAPTKNISRFEWFLEKATEIGIDEITPLLCEHSERKKIRLDRLEKILLSATKQSLKATLPKLNDLTTFEEFVHQSQENIQKYLGWCEEDTGKHLKDHYQAGQDVCILVGPEGGFSLQEVSQAREYGFETISFGESRLRTETAGLAACFAVNMLN